MKRTTAAAIRLPSPVTTTEATRPPSASRDFSLNVSPSQRMTTPSASPETIVLPSFDHAAETTAALCPVSSWFFSPEPADQAQNTFFPVVKVTGPLRAASLPLGSTASGTANRSAGSLSAGVAFVVIVDTFGHSSHVLTKQPRAFPKTSLWFVPRNKPC